MIEERQIILRLLKKGLSLAQVLDSIGLTNEYFTSKYGNDVQIQIEAKRYSSPVNDIMEALHLRSIGFIVKATDEKKTKNVTYTFNSDGQRVKQSESIASESVSKKKYMPPDPASAALVFKVLNIGKTKQDTIASQVQAVHRHMLPQPENKMLPSPPPNEENA